MAQVQYNETLFRATFPAFASTTVYPNTVIEMYWNLATNFISKWPQCGGGMRFKDQQPYAINLMAAHLLQLGTQAAAGQAGGVVTASTVGSVSVTLKEPPATNQWQFWLNQTPYGQQLLALLELIAVGGFYVASGANARGMFNQ